MASMAIKPARARAYILLMLLMVLVGTMAALGLQFTLVDPTGILAEQRGLNLDTWRYLDGVPNWWFGTVFLVFGALIFVSIPRLVFVFIDNRIALFDERGITVRTLNLSTRRVLWKELNSLNASLVGVRLNSTRGALSLPLLFGRTSVDEVLHIIGWFRPDLLAGQPRRYA